MIKSEHKLVCDHCSEEIVDKSLVSVVGQGKFLGYDDKFTTVVIENAKSWHMHLTCYDEYMWGKRLAAELLNVKRLEFDDEPVSKFYDGTHDECRIHYFHNHSTAPLRKFEDPLND